MQLNLIDELNLSKIKWKLMQPVENGGKNFSQEECNATEIDYKRFLKLAVLFPEKELVPTSSVDEMWHAHILDTTKYHTMCDQIFGHYLHHVPAYDEIEEFHQIFFAETSALYKVTFGEAPNTEVAAFSSFPRCGKCRRCKSN